MIVRLHPALILAALLVLPMGGILLGPELAEGRWRGPALLTAGGASSQTPAAGKPRVLVIYRRDVAVFAKVAQTLRLRSGWIVVPRPLDPAVPLPDQRRGLAREKAQFLVALGPHAEQVAAQGMGEIFWILALTNRYPALSDRPGAWLATGASPELLLEHVTLLAPRLRTLGVILRDGQASLSSELSRVCQKHGVTLVTAKVAPEGDPLRALLSLLRDRAGAVWLGTSIDGWTVARLRAARNIQALLRRPVVGVTREHVVSGLVMALDSSPADVAEAIHGLLLGQGAIMLERARAMALSGRQGRAHKQPTISTVLASELRAGQVSISAHAARSLGMDPRAVIKAGAYPVRP